MATPKSGGHVRIHVVAEETGVPETTLRAWERRYGIPIPDRTASGYRLYGRKEIDQVLAMRRLCDGGISASDAARQVHAAPVRPEEPNDGAAAARHAILDAVTKFDIDALERSLQQTLFFGDPLAILENIVEPVLFEIGTRWHRGELTVGQEHFASQRFGMLLRDLMRLASVDDAAPRVVLAGFEDDDHELGLLSLATRFGHWGYRPIFLGARTPPNAVRIATKAVSAAIVALSVTLTPERGRARELIDEYAAACGKTPWMVGGSGLAAIADLVRAAGGQVDPAHPKKLRAMLEGFRKKK